jgi:hypothetical protein
MLVTSEHDRHNDWTPGIATIFSNFTTRGEDKDISPPGPSGPVVSPVCVDEAPQLAFGGDLS